MAQTTTTDRKASAAEVRDHAAALLRLGAEIGVTELRLRDNGSVVIHSDQPGYRQAMELSRRASTLVGSHVQVVTDDVPAAVDAQPL